MVDYTKRRPPLQLDLFMRERQLQDMPVPGWKPWALLTAEEREDRRKIPGAPGEDDKVPAGTSQPSAFDTQVGGSHYKDMKIQPAVFLRQLGVPHLEGEAIYRILRHRSKAGRQDLEKAIHTLQLILELDYGKEGG